MAYDVEALERAKIALTGLSVGDAFGEQFFISTLVVAERVMQRITPPETPWNFTDDTNMALSIFENLQLYGEIRQPELARSFSRHFNPYRGYGRGMFTLLCAPEYQEDWRKAAAALFPGGGSCGNGSIMRVAPLGAYFADDLAKVVEQARLSAEVTHSHPEGIAGAIAGAVAAALAWRTRGQEITPADFIRQVAELTPASEVCESLKVAAALPFDKNVGNIVEILGNGSKVLCQDTVAFAIWCAAHHLKSYEDALWYTVGGLGDCDTTCAIVGGIVACHTGTAAIPANWLATREPLPIWPFVYRDEFKSLRLLDTVVGHGEALERALVALEGLTLGDGFGEHFFPIRKSPEKISTMLTNQELPTEKWYYTDDTNMALSVVATLNNFQRIDQDWLAKSFAQHLDLQRGYAGGAIQLLSQVKQGKSWRKVGKQLFDGEGSFGNGGAMRIAPLGAYFAEDLAKVVEQARLSAEVTHAHPEGIAGGIAVAVAAALAWRTRGQEIIPADFIRQVAELTPASVVREMLEVALTKPYDPNVENIMQELGNGSRVTAQDTVAFAIWCAVHHLKNFEQALWYTVSGFGDCDTTCAIVGGIVACHVGRAGLPTAWLALREELPAWILE